MVTKKIYKQISSVHGSSVLTVKIKRKLELFKALLYRTHSLTISNRKSFFLNLKQSTDLLS